MKYSPCVGLGKRRFRVWYLNIWLTPAKLSTYQRPRCYSSHLPLIWSIAKHDTSMKTEPCPSFELQIFVTTGRVAKGCYPAAISGPEKTRGVGFACELCRKKRAEVRTIHTHTHTWPLYHIHPYSIARSSASAHSGLFSTSFRLTLLSAMALNPQHALHVLASNRIALTVPRHETTTRRYKTAHKRSGEALSEPQASP